MRSLDWGEEWSDPGYALELDRMGFADGVFCGCEERGLEGEPTFWVEEQVGREEQE